MSAPLPNISPTPDGFTEINRAGLDNFVPEVFEMHRALGWSLASVVLLWFEGSPVPNGDYEALRQALSAELWRVDIACQECAPIYFGGQQRDLIDLPKQWRGQWDEVHAKVDGRMVTFPGEIWMQFLIETPRLDEGLHTLQTALQARGALDIARIGTVTAPDAVREHWPEKGKTY